MKLTHYGASQYDPDKFRPVVDRHWIKPDGGLWASPSGAEFGWRWWCQAEDWGLDRLSRSFEFDIDGKIFTINTVADMNELAWIEAGPLCCISFETMIACGYDAIYLTDAGQEATRFTRPRSLYGWDCECVLVMNPEVIHIPDLTPPNEAVSPK